MLTGTQIFLEDRKREDQDRTDTGPVIDCNCF